MVYQYGENIKVREALPEDCMALAQNLRQSDKDEVWASDHLVPIEAVKQSFEKSTICFTVTIKDAPIVMFGVCPFSLIGKDASIWMLASDDIKKIHRKFLKHSRAFIDVLLNYYPQLMNYVDERNKESIKWLKFCGAEIEEAKPYGIEQKLFHKFNFQRSLICA